MWKSILLTFVLIVFIIAILITIFSSCMNKGEEGNTDKNVNDKVELIIDTDVGADCDDMLALAYVAYAEESLNVDLKAITYSNSAEYGIPVIKTFYKSINKTPPPIGKACKEMKKYDNYCKEIVEKFKISQELEEAKDAVSVLRQALVDSEKVTICAIGPLSNISALINSQPDEISPLDGKELLRTKCEKIVVMSGKFENQEEQTPEWNTRLDIEATQNVINNFPAPVFFISHELGYNLITGKPIMDKYQYENPVSMAYMLYPGVIEAQGRHSWDPLAVCFAVEGTQEWFSLSDEVSVTINDDGRSYINHEIKSNHYIVYFKEQGGTTLNSKESVSKYIDSCAVTLYDMHTQKSNGG